MKEIIVNNQSDFEKIADDFNGVVIIKGRVVVERARESARVEARGSAHVEARGSARVVARGSAHVEAWGSAHVIAWESAHVEAAKYVAIHQMPTHTGVISGGVVIKPKWDTVEDWCEYHGLTIKDGVVVLYKAVDESYRSPHDYIYASGSMPVAQDWDGGIEECGGGLHFSPIPAIAAGFVSNPKKYMACPIAVEDMRTPEHGDSYPQKIKAHKVCAPIYEVDINGAKVD